MSWLAARMKGKLPGGRVGVSASCLVTLRARVTMVTRARPRYTGKAATPECIRTYVYSTLCNILHIPYWYLWNKNMYTYHRHCTVYIHRVHHVHAHVDVEGYEFMWVPITCICACVCLLLNASVQTRHAFTSRFTVTRPRANTKIKIRFLAIDSIRTFVHTFVRHLGLFRQ